MERGVRRGPLFFQDVTKLLCCIEYVLSTYLVFRGGVSGVRND